MARQHIPLKARVRYDGSAQIIDRRAVRDTELEKVPDPIYRMVSAALKKFRKQPAAAAKKGRPAKKKI